MFLCGWGWGDDCVCFLGLESVEFRCLGGGIGVMVGGV